MTPARTVAGKNSRSAPGAAHPADPRQDGVPGIVLRSRGRTLEASGRRHVLAEAVADGLAAAVSKVFAEAGPGSHLVAGALPFDRQAPAYLVCPEAARFDDAPAAGRTSGAGSRTPWTVAEHPSRAVYQRAVRDVLLRLAADDTGETEPLTKVVLARTLEVEAPHAIDPRDVLARLLDNGAEDAYCVPLLPAPDGIGRTLVGASPELLIEKRRQTVTSLPMAGSAPRTGDLPSDRAAAQALMQSAKDRVEHRLVVEWVLDTLAPHCRALHAPDGPVLASTATMWHLATPVEGELKREISSLELAAALHPTPAVCGTPRDRARDLIRGLEPFDRGFFGGAVGWCDATGDGRWMVAIRCAEIAGRTARLYAGAGLVRGSDPATEADETGAKFRTMLDALGIDERGRLTR